MTRRLVLGAVAIGAWEEVRGWQAPAEPDYRGLALALERYVREDGKVRYGALKKDLGPLGEFVKTIETFDGDRLGSRNARLAWWINVYNALILWSFAKEYPEQRLRLKNSITRYTYFFRRKFVVGGKERSLADIEDRSLREGFREPRIHFAIVCASASCPWLSRTIYTEANVLEKLEVEAVRYVGQERNVKVDVARRTVTVSQIFEWFQKDFGGSEAAVLRFLARYVKTARLDEPGWKLKYTPYDWTINDTE